MGDGINKAHVNEALVKTLAKGAQSPLNIIGGYHKKHFYTSSMGLLDNCMFQITEYINPYLLQDEDNIAITKIMGPITIHLYKL